MSRNLELSLTASLAFAIAGCGAPPLAGQDSKALSGVPRPGSVQRGGVCGSYLTQEVYNRACADGLGCYVPTLYPKGVYGDGDPLVAPQLYSPDSDFPAEGSTVALDAAHPEAICLTVRSETPAQLSGCNGDDSDCNGGREHTGLTCFNSSCVYACHGFHHDCPNGYYCSNGEWFGIGAARPDQEGVCKKGFLGDVVCDETNDGAPCNGGGTCTSGSCVSDVAYVGCDGTNDGQACGAAVVCTAGSCPPSA